LWGGFDGEIAQRPSNPAVFIVAARLAWSNVRFTHSSSDPNERSSSIHGIAHAREPSMSANAGSGGSLHACKTASGNQEPFRNSKSAERSGGKLAQQHKEW
jgi:hypothetical protein